ncbi:MAG: hypothetical protein KAU28_10285, partial [Phycisphaerae bacterium]|nr:hypothetical protein [Phycisphaerae bacterium]
TICSDGQAVVVSPPVGIAKVVVTDFGLDEKLADDDNPILLTGGLDQAMMSIGTAVDNLKSVSQTLKAELDPDRTEALLAKIHIIVDDLKMAAGHIAAITTDARPKVKKITTAMTETTERIEQYAKTDVAEILTKLRETNSEILQIAKDFRDVSTQAKEIMFVNRERIDEMIDNMTIVSANLKATSKEIRRNPWRLIYKPKPDEIHSQNIYDAARAFSNGAEQLDQAILKLTGLAKAHPEGLAADDPQLLKVRKQIEDAFLKFSKAEQSLWKELTK